MTPNPKEKVAELDQEIERLAKAVEEEKTETKGVLDDLRVKLRHNRLLTRAVQSQAGASGDTPIALPNNTKTG